MVSVSETRHLKKLDKINIKMKSLYAHTTRINMTKYYVNDNDNENAGLSQVHKKFELEYYNDISEFKNFSYQYNNYGFRDLYNEDWSSKNSPDEIWCFGCSITFGSGVHQRLTWPNIIRQKTGMKVRNFGVSGSGIQTTIRLLDSWLSHSLYKPKLILMHGFFKGRIEIKAPVTGWEQINSNHKDFKKYSKEIV